jgi:Tfp pilus assembly protein FimT
MELVVVCAVVGIVSAAGLPTLWSTFRSTTRQATVTEMKATLQRAKQLAITRRQNICVQPVAGAVQFRQVNCGGAAWTGSATDGAGNIRLTNNVAVTNGTPPIFTPTGGITAGASTFTLTPAGQPAATVTVSPTGRITSP